MPENKISISEQTPATTNSIISTKPKVSDVTNLLEGYIGNSWNGGLIKPVAWKKVTAGEKIINYNISAIIRMLTPKVPVAQKLKCTFTAYFVPNSRVWTDSEKFYSQKGQSTAIKIKSYPHIGNKAGTTFTLPIINYVDNDGNSKSTAITNTTQWRDSYVSSYIPRIGCDTTLVDIKIPKINVLPLRGFKAIYNDMIRHKIYDSPIEEYKTTNVEQVEISDYFSTDTYNIEENIIRGRRQDSYYTDYRSDLQGFDAGDNLSTRDLQEHTEWQKLISEARAQAENEQLNDWDIVAKIRGTRPVKDGKVRFLGKKTVGLNYTQVAQTSYNNAVTEENYQSLGVTGAYSYTEFSIDLINYEEFIEDGFIHIIQQTSADTIFETGIDRTLLNVNWDDEYRPDLKELKDDVLYDLEKDGTQISLMNPTKVTGFKRKFSEYFKLPTIINGDVSSLDLVDLFYEDGSDNKGNEITTQKAFQFTELSDKKLFVKYNGVLFGTSKKIWQDYTDITINRNLAIEQELYEPYSGSGNPIDLMIKGQNQLFMLGKASCITSQPLDNAIKANFKTWGEI